MQYQNKSNKLNIKSMKKNVKGFKFIGTIGVDNGIKVSDPCYDADTWCTIDIESTKILKGKYNCYIEMRKTNWGYRVGSLLIMSENAPLKGLPNLHIGNIGVDAGVCGFFDSEYFKETRINDETKENWYRKNVIDPTETSPNFFICDEKGVYSASGYGDGSYDVYARISEKDNSLYDAFIIRFV